MSVFGDVKPYFTSKQKPSWEIRLLTLLLRVMNNVFHVLQKSDVNFCLATNTTILRFLSLLMMNINYN